MTEKTIFSKEYKRIVQAIQKARHTAGLTQMELAKKLDKTQSYISKVEAAQVRVDAVQLKQIARVLRVNIRDLLR